MDLGAVRICDPVRAIIGAAEIEVLGGELAIVPFPYVADVVTVLTQQPGIAFGPGRLERPKAFVAVAGNPLPGEERGPLVSTPMEVADERTIRLGELSVDGLGGFWLWAVAGGNNSRAAEFAVDLATRAIR